ncbi:MAG: hypothetical protein H3C68_00015 [Deltaproteobacteria bacterium]|nr:hypothetical protein [Deltaproteobacteria bacterium]MBZ0219709.1 hypothetical protein [Deltaproteobacteria bacterium]
MSDHKLIMSLIAALFTLLALSGSVAAGPLVPEPVTRHSLKVSVDIASGTVEGTDLITLARDTDEARFILRAGTEVLRAHAEETELPFELSDLGGGLYGVAVKLPSGEKRLSISFRGKFQSPAEASQQVKKGVAHLKDGVIGEEGVFLPSFSYWFPQEPETLMVFEAEVALSSGYKSVMEGELVSSKERDGLTIETWKEWKPVDGVDLVAGRYFVEKETHNGIDIYTYFFSNDKALSRTYIEKTKGRLDSLQSLIGPYPFKKFAVVENFLPTGYGMPSFTLLGSTVIRLPFIPDTSLGHEIAHNWWGNSVFVDPSEGNWVEAITTYVADYSYEREKGPKEAREFRAAKLRGFKNYAEGSGIALKDFVDTSDSASRAVGYNKGFMVFNMLEEMLGEEAFKAGLKKLYSDNAFGRASWSNVRNAFEAASGRDLKWFFSQWLELPGGPVLALDNASYTKKSGSHAVSFTLRQASPAYALDLPVLIKTDAGEEWETVRLEKESEEFTIEVSARPTSVEIDPGLQTFRILDDREVPPTISGLLGDKGSKIIVPEKAGQKYQGAATLFSSDFGLEVISDDEAGRTDYLKDSSLLILGGPGENRFYRLTGQHFSRNIKITDTAVEVNGKSFPRKGTTLAVAVKNPNDATKTLVLLLGEDGAEGISAAARRVRHLTDFSYLVFTSDGKVEKGHFEGEKTLKHAF